MLKRLLGLRRCRGVPERLEVTKMVAKLGSHQRQDFATYQVGLELRRLRQRQSFWRRFAVF